MAKYSESSSNNSFEESSFDILSSAIKNSPDVVIEILSSLGYEIIKEDYIYFIEEPIYEIVTVTKTRHVPCDFPCFYRSEIYSENEQKFKGYKKVKKVSQRYMLKKKSK